MSADLIGRFLRARRWLILPVLLALVSPVRSACATPEQQDPARRAVRVVLVGTNPSEETELSTIWRTIAGMNVDLVFDRAASMNAQDVLRREPAHTTLVIWLDLSTPQAAQVYVTDGKNVFARRLEIGTGLDAVALDLLDVVVTSSAQAILSGQTLGVTREEFQRSLGADSKSSAADSTNSKRSANALSAPATNTAPFVLVLGAGYEAAWVGPGVLANGPKLQLEVRHSALHVGFSAQAQLQYTVSNGGATTDVTTQAFRLLLGQSFALSSRATLCLTLGAGLEIKHIHTTSTEQAVDPAPAFVMLDPLMRPATSFEQRLGPWLIGVLLGVDADLLGTAYTMRTPSGDHAIWTAFRLHPVGAISAGLPL